MTAYPSKLADKSRGMRYPWLWLLLAPLLCMAPVAQALNINKLAQSVIEDSEEPFDRRIYSYAIDTDADGRLHLIYSKPVPGQNRCEIFYLTGTPGQLNTTLLETDGKHGSISTALIVDKHSGIVHVSYIRHQNDPSTHLAYQTIADGMPSARQQIAMGGWHTRMQLNEDAKPIFVRENGPSLRMIRPGDEANTWNASVFAPSGNMQYRIADFVYDRDRGRFHVTYGDRAGEHKNAPLHNFRYAASPDATTWTASAVDLSLTLWENEFWTSLVIDPDGHPVVSMYKYAEYGGAFNTGTSLLLGRHDGTAWNTRLIVGAIPGETPPDHRAGMGGQLSFDENGILYGAWDNSPDYPYDFDGEFGNIAMDYSLPGREWRSQLQVEPFSAEGYCRIAFHGTNLYMLVLGNFADAKLYLIHLGIARAWDTGYQDLGNGWRRLDWFGDYVPMGTDGWIWHNRHGFFYVASSAAPESIWLYARDMGWLWTSHTLYPFLFRHQDQAWLWYNGATNPRWFRNMTTGQWESLP